MGASTPPLSLSTADVNNYMENYMSYHSLINTFNSPQKANKDIHNSHHFIKPQST